MRILSIGLGGAGCRIVDGLYSNDRRSSKVMCVQALAIDVQSDTLAQLSSLPQEARLCFPPLDPILHPEESERTQAAAIDVGEIISRIQNFDFGETDAIFVCCGLGGNMVDIAPNVISSLRTTTTEPIFGLVTLPCLAEGERRSAKAADDIATLSPLLDGIILFDNETWHKKIQAQRSNLVKKEKGLIEKIGIRKSAPEISPQLATCLLLNEAIIRRISLILRAGEFKADGGLDLAEVVLDSGEVLNTMKGMGFITIGYAVERLPQHPLSFLTGWHPTALFPDAHKIKASRIVDLAKQAIYHEISTPCDMTSAHKALILIAGPSHELSMKGFMTVRKWIDRSIAGLETRSGDYPVMNTKNVAIIIMLSGLENIPRLTEIREIQSQYKSRHEATRASTSPTKDMPCSPIPSTGSASAVTEAVRGSEGTLKDEMVILPIKSPEDKDTADQPSFGKLPDSAASTATIPGSGRQDAMGPGFWRSDRGGEEKGLNIPEGMRARIQVQDSFLSKPHPRPIPEGRQTQPTNRPVEREDIRIPDGPPRAGEELLTTKKMERQIIERELQRQRSLAVSGYKTKAGPLTGPKSGEISEKIAPRREFSKKKEFGEEPISRQKESSIKSDVFPKERVIIRRKKVRKGTIDRIVHDSHEGDSSDEDEENFVVREPVSYQNEEDFKGGKIRIRGHQIKSRDNILEGKGVQKPASPHASDSALVQTHLKPKKIHSESNTDPSAKKDDGGDVFLFPKTTKKERPEK